MPNVLTAVIETPAYLSSAAKIMSAEEMAAVVDYVAAHPHGGVLIKGSGGLRKARIPLAGRGKRGGGRVIYWYHNENYPAALLWAFAKNAEADLSKAQLSKLAAYAALITADLENG